MAPAGAQLWHFQPCVATVARRHSFPARSRVQITSLNSPDENPMRRSRSGFYFASHQPISTHCASYSISSRFDAQRLRVHRKDCGALTDLVVKCEGKCFKYPELRELARPAIFHASLERGEWRHRRRRVANNSISSSSQEGSSFLR